MSSLLVHCHGENWKSPTRSFGRSGKAKRTFQGTKRTFSLSQMNNVELARTLSWRELEIANTELWAKWKGKTHFSRNGKEQYKSFVISVMSQLRRKTTKNKEDATKCLLHPPPCVGLIVLLLIPLPYPFVTPKA